jgi:vitamin B12/bleomycin/antimicrobial peptide transport system ATP-binding/permease protein
VTSIKETASTNFGQNASVTPLETTAHQLRSLIAAVWRGGNRRSLLLLTMGAMAVISATALGQIRLNAWNKPFYDAIARKDLDTFLSQLFIFALIVAVLLVLNVSQAWLHQMIRLKLREWLTHDLIAQWLQQKREFRITRVADIGANPDQRIHQDGQHLTDLSTDLGVGLFQSSILLASFIGVLWVLSGGVVLTIAGHGIIIPGYMVWAALLYAATGSWLSWRAGRPLMALNTSRYAREAVLRAALVRTHGRAHCVALYGKERDEQRYLFADLMAVLGVMRQIIGASVRLTWVTAGYGWIAIVVPILVASPGYFGGELSFGELMMVVGAFYQVQQALRWFVDNVGAIADWRATLLRVMSFRDALMALELLEERGERIELAEDPAGHLRFEGLSVMTPTGPAHLAEGDIEVKPGERVLVVGKPASGKTTLFLTIAGLSPWGTGRILLPRASSMAFLSQRPYVPPGTLREALGTPVAGHGTDAELVAALRRVGLGHLSHSLDQIERWGEELTIVEQHRLAVAHVLLTRPQWVISDEALDVLDDDASEGILSIFRQELVGTAVLSFARRQSSNHFYTRLLHLVGPPERSSPVVANAS